MTNWPLYVGGSGTIIILLALLARIAFLFTRTFVDHAAARIAQLEDDKKHCREEVHELRNQLHAALGDLQLANRKLVEMQFAIDDLTKRIG